MNAQALRDNSTSSYMQPKKTLEINGTHPVITKLIEQLNDNADNKSTKEMINLLWDTALLSSGFSLKNPSALSSRINRMVAVALDVTSQLEELPPIIEPTVTEAKADSGDSADLKTFDDVD
jgi:molecular chaperone HtpG